MENNKAKKIIGFFAMATVLLIVGCKEQPAEQTVEKEVIVVPAPVVIEKEVPAKKTTVILDRNGVEVDAKNVKVKIE
jgi:lipoprotein NlpI